MMILLDNTVIIDSNGLIAQNTSASNQVQNDPTVITGGQGQATTNQTTQTTEAAPPVEQQPPDINYFNIIIMYAVVIAAAYFFWIRPQKKREKSIKEMQAGIKSGDNVITSSGFYGKVVSVGEDCFVIEFGTNKGIRIPVNKTDVIGVREPKVNLAKEAETTT